MRRQLFNDNWNFAKGSGSVMAALFGGGAEAKPVTLPHDAEVIEARDGSDPTASGNGYFVPGNYNYSKTFVPTESGQRYVIHFEGVYQNAYVYVNNSFAAKHPYGYGDFYVDITRFLKLGQENKISVNVKNGGSSGRWYTGGGIYRDVYLLTGGMAYLEEGHTFLETVEADPKLAVICAHSSVKYRGIETKTLRLRTEILDMAGELVTFDEIPVTVCEGETQALWQKLYVTEPKRWSAETPVLYSYRLTLTDGDEILDQETDTFGIRTIQVDPVRGFRVNGQVVNLKGGCIHHDTGVVGTAEFSHAEHERMRKMKAAGYNAIRCSHYPASPRLLKACDEVGMYVMDEFSDVWTTTKVDFDYGMNFADWYEYDVENMVRKDFNHPSVVMYSIGNEIPEAGNRFDEKYGKAMADLIRSLDGTRPILNSLNLMLAVMDRFGEVMAAIGAEEQEKGGEINELMTNLGTAMGKITGSEYVSKATEEASAHVDITGLNYAATRYENDGRKYPNRVIVGSETYPQDLDYNWEQVEKFPYVIGDFSWTGWDYLGEVGIGLITYGEGAGGFYKPYPYRCACCGDFDILGDRIAASYWREIVWGGSNGPVICVQDPIHYGEKQIKTQWSFSDAVRTWTFRGFEGKPVHVEVYSNAEEIELIQNSKSIGKKPVGIEKKYMVTFDTTYEAGTIEAVAYCDGIECGRDILTSADAYTAITAVCDCPSIPADGSDIAFVEITMTDTQGRVDTQACDPVKISVEGPGYIMGYGSANPYTEENFFDEAVKPFNGRLRAAVRGNGEGILKVTLSDENGKTTVVEVPVV